VLFEIAIHFFHELHLHKPVTDENFLNNILAKKLTENGVFDSTQR
jgi:hypothetical protein